MFLKLCPSLGFAMLTVTFEHELAANYSGFCPFKQLFFRLEKEERMAVLSLPVIPSDRGDDLHNLDMMEDSDLNLFMAGNQFMVMAELLAAFQRRYPRIRRIYYQTLPPGLQLRQILADGAIFQGKRLNVRPDIYASVNQQAMDRLEAAGRIGPGGYHLYLHNRLTLMVPAGNPARISSVLDLGRDAVRISQPDPQNEHIAFHIQEMYRAAGGEALVHRIMEEKRAEATAIFTVVHHRETPLRLQKKTVDVGPVWATEAQYARTTGLAFETVEPGADQDQREHIHYYICQLNNGPHQENAQRFLDFIQSKPAQEIYEIHGFLPHIP